MQLFNQGNSSTNRNLVSTALDLQKNILISPLVVAGVLFLMSVFLFSLSRMAFKKKGLASNSFSRWLRPWTLGLVWLSTGLAFVAAFATTVSVNALQFATNVANRNLLISAGIILQVLQWTIVGLSIFFSWGVTNVLRVKGPTAGAQPATSAYNTAFSNAFT